MKKIPLDSHIYESARYFLTPSAQPRPWLMALFDAQRTPKLRGETEMLTAISFHLNDYIYIYIYI